MAVGVEFLGKCIDTSAPHWNMSKSKKNFEGAIKNLNGLKTYKPYLKSHKLWDSLRNGFAHSFVIKGSLVGLSSGLTPNEHPNLTISNGILYLKCEDFYNDFKLACEDVKARSFVGANNKMNNPLIHFH